MKSWRNVFEFLTTSTLGPKVSSDNSTCSSARTLEMLILLHPESAYFTAASASWPFTTGWLCSQDSWGLPDMFTEFFSGSFAVCCLLLSWTKLWLSPYWYFLWLDRSNIFDGLTKLKEAWTLTVSPCHCVMLLPRYRFVSCNLCQAGLIRFVGEKNFKVDKDIKAGESHMSNICQVLPFLMKRCKTSKRYAVSISYMSKWEDTT